MAEGLYAARCLLRDRSRARCANAVLGDAHKGQVVAIYQARSGGTNAWLPFVVAGRSKRGKIRCYRIMTPLQQPRREWFADEHHPRYFRRDAACLLVPARAMLEARARYRLECRIMWGGRLPDCEEGEDA
jgi:hypothetical protein